MPLPRVTGVLTAAKVLEGRLACSPAAASFCCPTPWAEWGVVSTSNAYHLRNVILRAPRYQRTADGMLRMEWWT